MSAFFCGRCPSPCPPRRASARRARRLGLPDTRTPIESLLSSRAHPSRALKNSPPRKNHAGAEVSERARFMNPSLLRGSGISLRNIWRRRACSRPFFNGLSSSLTGGRERLNRGWRARGSSPKARQPTTARRLRKRRSFERRFRSMTGARNARFAQPGPGAMLAAPAAGLAQLVERKLPKLDVAGSNPVPRSEPLPAVCGCARGGCARGNALLGTLCLATLCSATLCSTTLYATSKES